MNYPPARYLLATSPRYDLRDGSKALELAQLNYKATGYPESGALWPWLLPNWTAALKKQRGSVS